MWMLEEVWELLANPGMGTMQGLESACGFGMLAMLGDLAGEVRKSHVLILSLMTSLTPARGETPSMSKSCKAMEQGRAST